MLSAKKLRRQMERKNITDRELGELVGVSTSTINRYRTEGPNGRQPRGDTLYWIAKALDCKESDLLFHRRPNPARKEVAHA